MASPKDNQEAVPEETPVAEGMSEEELLESAMSGGDPEEGGMPPGLGQGEAAKCEECGKVLDDDDIFEREVNGDVYQFCSVKCAETYMKKHTVG